MADDIFLLDTNVISDSSKKNHSPSVSAWMKTQRRIAIPFPVILEVETGIAELLALDEERATRLRVWFDGLLKLAFVLPSPTPPVARILAAMYCCHPLQKHWRVDPRTDRKPGQDLFIAAISIAHDMPIATMNHVDFKQIDQFFALPGVYNPNLEFWAVPRSEKVTPIVRKEMKEKIPYGSCRSVPLRGGP